MRHFLGPYNRKMWRVPLAGSTRPGPRGRSRCRRRHRSRGRRARGRSCVSGTTRSFTTRGGRSRGAGRGAGAGRFEAAPRRAGRRRRPAPRRVETLSGRTWAFERLVSTAPLPELLRMTRGLPAAVSAGPSGCAASRSASRTSASPGRPRRWRTGSTSPSRPALLPGGVHDELRPLDRAVRLPHPLRRGDAPVRRAPPAAASAGAAFAAGSSGRACSARRAAGRARSRARPPRLRPLRPPPGESAPGDPPRLE